MNDIYKDYREGLWLPGALENLQDKMIIRRTRELNHSKNNLLTSLDAERRYLQITPNPEAKRDILTTRGNVGKVMWKDPVGWPLGGASLLDSSQFHFLS